MRTYLPDIGGACEILGFDPKHRPPIAPLARPRLGAATDLKGGLDALASLARRRSIAFVISDFYAEGWERPLAMAAAKHDVIPVTLVDPRDLELPDVGLVTFEDLESGQDIVVDTSDPKVRAYHARAMRELFQARRQLFGKLGVDSVDMELVRSVFDPDCVVVGTMEEGSLDDYLEGLEEGLLMYDATMHFRGNQYVEIDGTPTGKLAVSVSKPGSTTFRGCVAIERERLVTL
jgi:hypothetical protein